MTENTSTFILINTFALPPKKQNALVMLLKDFTEQVTCFMPGFVSATVHRGLDDTHIVNYVRWQTREHFIAMLADPRAQAHIEQTRALALSITPVFYEIVYHYDRQLARPKESHSD